MGKLDKLKNVGKKAGILAGKSVGTVLLGTVGVVSKACEEVCVASNSEILTDIAHGVKSASFNGVRKMWGKEEKAYGYETGEFISGQMNDYEKKRAKAEKEYLQKINERQAEIDNLSKINGAKVEEEQQKLEQIKNNFEKSRTRRTDEDLENDTSGLDRNPNDFSIGRGISLEQSLNEAPGETGVYVIYLDGSVKKCGRAAYGQGLHWRFQQYYSLQYDNRARAGDYWSITPENRDRIQVSWQACPTSKCKELESKLFDRYGSGDWAKRRPQYCSDNTWELLI